MSQLLERSPAEKEIDPYPADGAAVTANPPAFRWLPHGDVVEWRVRLAGPQGESIEFGPLPDPVLALPRKLAPGLWRWQFAGYDQAGQLVGQGRERSFTVAAGLKGFVLPDVGRLARRWKNLRPRVFGPRIAEIRQQLAERPNPHVDRLEQWCEMAAGEPLIAEPEPFGPHPSDSQEWNDDWIRIYSAGKIGSAHAARFALSYLLTDNAAHLALAKRWAMHQIGWNPCGSTSEFVNDEASMPMLERLSWVYDWLRPHWTDRERKAYLDCMQMRGQEVMLKYRRINFASSPYNNHMCRQLAFLGGAGIAFLGDIPQAADWLRYVLTIMTTSYPSGSWGSNDGGWANGLSYWAAYMGFLSSFIGAADQLGLKIAQSPYYRNTGDFAIYHLPPYAPRGGFGDHAEGGPGFPHKLVVGTFGRAARQARHVDYAAQINADLPPPLAVRNSGNPCPTRRWDAWNLPEMLSLLVLGETGEPAAPAETPAPKRRPLPPARLFASIGWVSMHSALGQADRDVWMEFKSGPFGSVSHSHADQNSFNLYAYGRPLLLDSGYYPWYGSPHDVLWTRQSWAHNMVLVDGHGQPPWDWLARGRVESFASVDGFAYSRGEAAEAYNRPGRPDVIESARKHRPDLVERMGPGPRVDRASRSVLMVTAGQSPFFVVLDYLQVDRAARFQWLAHAGRRMDLLESGQGFDLLDGPARLAVRFVAPRSLALSQDDQFVVRPEGRAANEPNQWHLTASTVEPARTARFMAVLAPYRDGEPAPAIELLRDGATIGARVGKTEVLAPAEGAVGPIIRGELSAVAAAVAVGPGGRIFAAEAEKLSLGSQVIRDSDQPESFVADGK